MDFEMPQWVMFGAELLLPLLCALCALFCFLYRRLSAGLLFAVVGFLLEAAATLISSSAFLLLQRRLQEATTSGAHLWVRKPLCDVVAFALIGVGLIMTLRDLSQRVKRLRQAADEEAAPFVLPVGSPQLSRARKDNSHDVQQ